MNGDIRSPHKFLSGVAAFTDTQRPLPKQWFTVPALLAAALFSVVVALPFLPAAKDRPDLFRLEARITSTVDAAFQVYFDDGKGLREELSSRATLSASATSAVYRLPLPPGKYRSLRLDPLDRAGTITLESLQVVSSSGRNLADLPVHALTPIQQIATTQSRQTGLEIATLPSADDPQLAVTFNPPLVVTASWQDYARDAAPVVLPIFMVLAALLFLFERAPRLRRECYNRGTALALHPTRAIALTAALAVIGSAYPVIFAGKSFVSPNFGTVLLYDAYPTLPGSKSTEVVDAKLSDVGAIMWQHVPFSMVQHRALASGELPLWNRHNAAGVPLLAQGQSMFGDPLHLFVIAANGAAWAWDIKYLVAKFLFAAGLGLTVFALIRPTAPTLLTDESSLPSDSPRSRSSLVAALLVAFAAPFIGFFVYRINHPAFFSLCYAPWPLFFLVQIARASTRRSHALNALGLIAANLALMNSGTVKEAYMLMVCVNFSGACIILASPAAWRDRFARIATVAAASVVFVLLTAPIWATFLQTLKNAYTGYNAVSAFQIQPSLLLGAFDEIFYRPLMEDDRVFSPSLNFLLLLGVLYFLATLRIQFSRPAVVALAASSLLPLSLAFGLFSPQWIVTVPFLANIAHLDNTFSCVLIVLWSVIAGVGFATAVERLGTREGRDDLIIAGLLFAALIFGWIAFRQAAHRPIFGPIVSVHKPGEVLFISPFIWNYLGALVVAAAALMVLAHRGFVRRSCSAARGLLALLCMLTLLWRHGLHTAAIGYEDFTVRPPPRADFHARSGAVDLVRTMNAREPARGYGFNGNFFAGWTAAYGLETIHGPDALVNPWLRELVGVGPLERLWDWRLYLEAPGIAKARAFLDALNVRFYFDALSKHPALTSNLRALHQADLDVYESPTAWPRAFFTDRVDTYTEPAELVAKFNSANGRPLAAIQKSDLSAQPNIAALTSKVDGRVVQPATDYKLTENNTAFRIRAPSAGVIVLTEAYWPKDFIVELNGRRGEVIRLNHAFKGVWVEAAGDYAVTFRYWPQNFTRNLILSAVGCTALLIGLIIALRSTPRDPRRRDQPQRVDRLPAAA